MEGRKEGKIRRAEEEYEDGMKGGRMEVRKEGKIRRREEELEKERQDRRKKGR